VKNHDDIDTIMPSKLQLRKRYDVGVNWTIAPDMRVPTGCAAIDNAVVTEPTLPCMSRGTTICIIVCIKTFAIGMHSANIKAPRAMNQNDPRGVNAMSA
jgi:hypothetical protein